MLSDRLLYTAEFRARSVIRSVLWSLLALFAGIGALGFLGAAFWLWISAHHGAVLASFGAGLGFLVVAAAAVMVAKSSRHKMHPPAPGLAVSDLAEAFFAAQQFGRAAREGRRRRGDSHD